MGQLLKMLSDGGAPGCTEAEYAILCGIGGALNASSQSDSNHRERANELAICLNNGYNFPHPSTK
jgi:hypothetical protein